MVRIGRFALTVWLLLAIAAAAGIHLALDAEPSDGPQEGFLAYGRVTVTIPRSDVNTPRTKRCIANSVEAGTDVRQGIPVVISLDGRAVGGGELSSGQLIHQMTQRIHSESSRATCQYKFSAPVTEPGEGQYTVDIGDAKIAFSAEDLRNGINLGLS